MLTFSFCAHALRNYGRCVNAQVCAENKLSFRKAISFPTTISGIHFCFLGRNYEIAYFTTADEWTQVFIKWKWPSTRFLGHCSLNGKNVAGHTDCSGIGTKLVYRTYTGWFIEVTTWMKTSACKKSTREWRKQVQDFVERYLGAFSTRVCVCVCVFVCVCGQGSLN
jgi:hypothetical protein